MLVFDVLEDRHSSLVLAFAAACAMDPFMAFCNAADEHRGLAVRDQRIIADLRSPLLTAQFMTNHASSGRPASTQSAFPS